MNKLSYLLLDKILKDIRDSTDTNPINLEAHLKTKYELPNRDVRGIREKLIEDKMIKSFIPTPVGNNFIPNREYQYITFDGLMLLQDRGYVGKRRKEKFLRTLQLWLTILICFGTLVAAYYYYHELKYPYRHDPSMSNHCQVQDTK